MDYLSTSSAAARAASHERSREAQEAPGLAVCKGETMKTHLLTSLLCMLSWTGFAFEGTPAPGCIDGKVFVGTIRSSDKAAKAVSETITGGSGEITSAWAVGLGFGALKWLGMGEISGDKDSERLEISVQATNAAKDMLQMRVYVDDQKILSAVAKLTKANGTVSEFKIEATLKPLNETDEFKRALKDIEDIDAAVETAPAHYIAPDLEVEKKLNQRVSLTVNARPLGQCLNWLTEKIRIPIVCDIQWDGHPKVNIEANDKPVREILDDLTKQAKVEYVVRGRAVLVTKPERAAKLRLTPDKPANDGKP